MKTVQLLLLILPVAAVAADLGVGFDDKAKGSVVALDVMGEDWGVPTNRVGIWHLVMTKKADFGEQLPIVPSMAHGYRREETADGLRFVWDDFRGREAGVVERVEMTVRREGGGGGKVRWHLTVTCGEEWANTLVTFPRIFLKPVVGAGDRMTWGGCEAGVVREPWDRERNPKAFLGGDEQPATLAAQFLCRYTDDRLFYFAAEDGEGWSKSLSFSREEKQGAIGVLFAHRGWAEGTFEMPYDFVTAVRGRRGGEPCDWFDAADLYRTWALGQRWCAKTLLEREDLPALYKSAPIMFTFGRSWLDAPERVAKFLEKRATDGLDGADALATIVGWEHHCEWVGPDYFPMYPSDEQTKGVFRRLRAAKVRPYLWPSTYNCTYRFRMPEYLTHQKQPDDAPFAFDRKEEFVAAGLDKAATLSRGGTWSRGAPWIGRGGEMAALCLGWPGLQEWFDRTTLRPCMERGATLLQLDQFNGACRNECWSRAHGHPPHAGRWKLDHARRNIRHAVEEMRKYDAEGVMTFEGPDEQLIDLLALQDTRDCRFFRGDWAHPFTYLYHDFVTPFQAGMHDNWFWRAKVAAEGQMPRYPSDISEYEEDGTLKDAAKGRFLAAWARLWRGEGKPYLAYGRHIRPPRLECEHVRYRDKWRGIRIDMDMPAVFHAAYRAADGSRAIVLVNATAEPRSGALVHGARRVGVSLAPYEIKLLK